MKNSCFTIEEAVIQRCFLKKMFWKISQNSPGTNCARASFLIKVLVSGWAPRLTDKETFLILEQIFDFTQIKILNK